MGPIMALVVTHDNRTRDLSHRKRPTNQLCLDYELSGFFLSPSSKTRHENDHARDWRRLGACTVLKPGTARSVNCANLYSFVFPPPTHGAYHKRSELINFTKKKNFSWFNSS